MEQVQDVSQRSNRKRWLVAAAPVVALMMFGSAAWACVGGTQENLTKITSADKGSVGFAVVAKATGGQLPPGLKLDLVFANTTSGECHHGDVIGGPAKVKANGNIGNTDGVVPQRSKGTYEVCFGDDMTNTAPDFFTVTR